MRALLERLERLEEKTFDISKDVDFIYRKMGAGKFHSIVSSGDMEKIKNVIGKIKYGDMWVGSSGDLKSEDAMAANEINPVSIRAGVYRDGSFYIPGKNIIQISLNMSAIDALKHSSVQLRGLRSTFGDQADFLQGELDASNVKGTIAHELSHWISDSLYNGHIGKRLASVRDNGNARGFFSGVNQEHFEIDAQIHAIREIARQAGEEKFNKMGWKDLMMAKSSLRSNFKIDGLPMSRKQYSKTMKTVLKRLNREGLLGDGLKSIPSYSEYVNMVRN